jgi:hypothetical protein
MAGQRQEPDGTVGIRAAKTVGETVGLFTDGHGRDAEARNGLRWGAESGVHPPWTCTTDRPYSRVGRSSPSSPTGSCPFSRARTGSEDPLPSGDGDGVTTDADPVVLDGDGQAATAGGCLERAEAATPEASGPQRAENGVS